MLYALPGIAEAAVVGVPDDVLGHTQGDHRRSPENALSERDVIAHCVARLEDFMVPRLIEFRESLPKTTTGKIQRAALQAEVDSALRWYEHRHWAPACAGATGTALANALMCLRSANLISSTTRFQDPDHRSSPLRRRGPVRFLFARALARLSAPILPLQRARQSRQARRGPQSHRDD